jgi:hypothetical protein
MATYGLTTDGFIVKTLNVIRDELNTRMKDVFGKSLKLDDRSIFGQINGIVSEIAALVWEMAEVINSSQDPDKATGAALDALCTLTGTIRPPASYSTVTLTLTGTPTTTTVPAGSIVTTDSTLVSFQTTEDSTLDVVDAWVGSDSYVVDDRVTNGGNVYQCTTAGTADSSGGPTTEDEEITDGSVTWTFVGNGTGASDVVARATETGPLVASARDLITISSQISGWDSVINLLDATPGRDVASDEELRQLREAELASPGNTPIDALRGDLLDVPDVVAVTVFVNNTDATNSDGMPPHSVECMVRGPDDPDSDFDQSIWDALLANVAAGIVTYGGVTGTATDSQGTDHTMSFSRPVEDNIYVYLNLTVDEDEYPEDGDDLVAQAVVDWGDVQLTGKDAVPSAVVAQAFAVDGVLVVNYVAISTTAIATPAVWAGTTGYVSGDTVLSNGRVYRCTDAGTSGSTGPSASGTGIVDGSVEWEHLGETIAEGLRHLAVYDTSRISVVSAAGVP